jgi:hypothetical protein
MTMDSTDRHRITTQNTTSSPPSHGSSRRPRSPCRFSSLPTINRFLRDLLPQERAHGRGESGVEYMERTGRFACVKAKGRSGARRCEGEPYPASRSAILRRLLTCRPSGGHGGLDLAVDLPSCPSLPLFVWARGPRSLFWACPMYRLATTRANENLTQLLVPPRLDQILFHIRGLAGD